ncbi:IS3 family transposase [Litoribacter populi]|uniref:IS3 family transposase n=1 Tax=Litoribacter populi TaxID=2598460 RepID=UPI001F23D74E|nr:IS3 family transposase [Litoribacter populi]
MRTLCRYFGYSTSAYYSRVKQLARQEVDRTLILEMARRVRKNHPRMGSKKVYRLLEANIRDIDPGMGRDKFLALLRQEGLLVIRKKKYAVTTQTFYRYHQYKDHFNGKTWNMPGQAWVCDITYIRVRDTFKYLFLMTDAFSRKIVGWHLAGTLESKWAVEAAKMAIKQCSSTAGLVHHSDRGFQYCSKNYINLLKKNGIITSMGQAGYCYDNAMAERVNGILKEEYGLDLTYQSGAEAFTAVKQAVKFYNEGRPHWSLKLEIPARVHDRPELHPSHKRKDSFSREPVKAK